MKNIIYEYSSVENDLKSHILKTRTLHPYFSNTLDGTIKSKNYCGIINYNEQDYYLLPKISKNSEQNLDIFTYMFMYAYNLNIKNEHLSSAKNLKTENILEVFIQLFAKNLLQEFQKGVYKTYITKEENLKVLKGKYLIDENIKYNTDHTSIYCSYDEFSQDNALNRFFLYAIKVFLHYVKNKKLLKSCELALDDVEYRHHDPQRAKISFDRMNIRYKKSFEIAKMLLQKIVPTFAQGKQSFAFLFDMNELFEKFVGNLFYEVERSTQLQTQKRFGNLFLQPDILLQDKIIDTKYKIVQEKNELSTQDKYQMFVYGTNFEVKYTMLLYPKHNNHIDVEPLQLGLEDKEIMLELQSIDLFCDGVTYGEYIEVMKERVREILGGNNDRTRIN